MFLVLCSACTERRTIVGTVDEAIRALRWRRLARPPCVGGRSDKRKRARALHACLWGIMLYVMGTKKLSVVRRDTGCNCDYGHLWRCRWLILLVEVDNVWMDGRSSSRDLATATGIACFGGEAAFVFFICAGGSM